MTEPDREKVTKYLQNVKNSGDVETYLASVFSKVPDEPPANVLSFTEVQNVFHSDGHSLIVGRTGYGKTTLLLTLLKRFLDDHWKVLYRDDGGCEFGYLSRYFKTQIFIPEGEDIKLNVRGFVPDVVRTNSPKKIIEMTYANNYPLNVIVFDAYVVNPAVSAKFYSKLFMELIHKCQQTPRRKKQRLIFSIDELNDLIAPHGRGMTGTHESLLGLFETNVRKLRKHKVRLISSTHRFTQLSVNVRSQCDHIFVKKCYGADIWDFMSRALITANNKTFWKVLRYVISMPRNVFMYFDPNGKFDFHTFLDIPRAPSVDVEALGIVEDVGKDEKKVKANVHTRVGQELYLLGKGYQHKDIAKMLGARVTPNTVATDLHKFKSYDINQKVLEMLSQK